MGNNVVCKLMVQLDRDEGEQETCDVIDKLTMRA